MPFLHQKNTYIQVCPDYSKNLLFALLQKWQFLSYVLAWNQIGCLQSSGTWRVATARTAQVPLRELWQLQLACNCWHLLDLLICISVARNSSQGFLLRIECFNFLPDTLWCFDSIDWERSWSSFSLKNFISFLKAARSLHFSSASGPLLGRPAIFQWLTASRYLAFNSFACSFHPGTLKFDGFRISNICLPLLSILANQ